MTHNAAAVCTYILSCLSSSSCSLRNNPIVFPYQFLYLTYSYTYLQDVGSPGIRTYPAFIYNCQHCRRPRQPDFNDFQRTNSMIDRAIARAIYYSGYRWVYRWAFLRLNNRKNWNTAPGPPNRAPVSHLP